MNKQKLFRLMTHFIAAAVGAAVLFFVFDRDLQGIIIFVATYMVLSIILDFYRDQKQAKRMNGFQTEADAELNRKVIEALGGNDNIETASHDGNRVTIKTKNVDLIDQEKLEALSLDGAVLTGDQLKISVGVSSEDFARLTIEKVNK